MEFRKRLVDWLAARGQKDHTVAIRVIAMVFGVTLFLIGIPAFIFAVGILADHGFIFPQTFSKVAAIICFIVGIPWVSAAVLWQLIYGKGTPVPAVPTKNFLQNGPYRYVRNPMILGFFIYLLGWSFLFNQPGAFLAAGMIALLLICEIKFIEEPELEIRFKDAYLAYKKETPFFFPKWRCMCKN